MKELTRTSRTAGYLEKIFRKLNAEFFKGEEIAEPVITLTSTPRAYGHVTVAKVWKVKDSDRHELNISADTMNRPIEEVCATMLHEMVHLYNIEHNVQDCSRNGTYHNKAFKKEAEKRGLIIDHDTRYGWTITNPSDRLIEWILSENLIEIDMTRGGGLWGFTGIGGTSKGTGNNGTIGKKPSSTRKYQCPCCGNSVRATKAVNIACMDCNEPMNLVL